jgi:hypothetical protein
VDARQRMILDVGGVVERQTVNSGFKNQKVKPGKKEERRKSERDSERECF